MTLNTAQDLVGDGGCKIYFIDLLKEAIKKRNVIKVQKGAGGSALKIKKSTIQNLDYFEMRGWGNSDF